ncbi:MAG: hypothetical protein WAX14_19175 [Rhodococcus sp. (in: high G+C Gram-positive bacteria)]|uniref:ATP-grasp domain-containing protein n=1 Tax=Rhodococcus sp. TaxID=1831 RepID=UPI003BB7A679
MTAHIVIINRWQAPYADYESYIDHARHHVSYVTTDIGSGGVPAVAAATALVAATDNLDEVRAAVAALECRFGPPRAIVALKEDDLLTAAQLTAERGLPGRTPDQLSVFRDKLAMARAVHAAGLNLPDFAAADSAGTVVEFGDEHGWPVVVKPTLGSSSEGVLVFATREAVDPQWRPDPAGSLVQAWVDGRLFHVDGLFDGRAIGPWRASRYLGTPLEFRQGHWIGSVEVDDASTLAAIEDFTARLLPALTTAPTVFHLEVFVDRTSAGEPQCTFVEIGARAGGAEIPIVWRDVHRFDLMGAAFALAANGWAREPLQVPGGDDYGGLLLIPSPTERPCRVATVRRVHGTAAAPPELYAEDTVAVGDVIASAPSYYEHVGGRFRFRGASTAVVEAAIRTVAAAFSISGTTIGAVSAVSQ